MIPRVYDRLNPSGLQLNPLPVLFKSRNHEVNHRDGSFDYAK
ncbi:hypothetical protein SAMN05446037_10182 [Anaerovirgula multivorans]|uniref:Uncharacterized protein n=1 Tax=Anaerovirgula multivorans TaxID=312168 RepID=A0A239GRD0_9FIRM|nr:hypothetical protein SAMN05446037_10182 [Anaerovirgula multivorans]